ERMIFLLSVLGGGGQPVATLVSWSSHDAKGNAVLLLPSVNKNRPFGVIFLHFMISSYIQLPGLITTLGNFGYLAFLHESLAPSEEKSTCANAGLPGCYPITHSISRDP